MEGILYSRLLYFMVTIIFENCLFGDLPKKIVLPDAWDRRLFTNTLYLFADNNNPQTYRKVSPTK